MDALFRGEPIREKVGKWAESASAKVVSQKLEKFYQRVMDFTANDESFAKVITKFSQFATMQANLSLVALGIDPKISVGVTTALSLGEGILIDKLRPTK